MKGLEALAKHVGVPPSDGKLYVPSPVPADRNLTFEKDAYGIEYGFRAAPGDRSVIECFYMRHDELGHMPIAEVTIVSDDSAEIPLNGALAAIIYRPARGKHPTGTIFLGSELVQAYNDMPHDYAGYSPDPRVFVEGRIVVRMFSAKGLQWQAEDRAQRARPK